MKTLHARGTVIEEEKIQHEEMSGDFPPIGTPIQIELSLANAPTREELLDTLQYACRILRDDCEACIGTACDRCRIGAALTKAGREDHHA